jgi:hypothetical protein
VWNFSIFASRCSELSLWVELAFSPVRGSRAKYFSIGFILEINKSSGNSKYGAAKSPGLGQFPSSKFVLQNYICISAVVGSQYWAMTKAAESLIAQLYSQGKLTTPHRENRKIRHENEILKANKHAPHTACVHTSDLWHPLSQNPLRLSV